MRKDNTRFAKSAGASLRLGNLTPPDRDYVRELAEYAAAERITPSTAERAKPKRDRPVNARTFPAIVARTLAVFAGRTSPATRPNVAAGFAIKTGAELLLKIAGKDFHAIHAAELVVRARGAFDESPWFESFGFVVGDLGGGKPIPHYLYLTPDEDAKLVALHEHIHLAKPHGAALSAMLVLSQVPTVDAESRRRMYGEVIRFLDEIQRRVQIAREVRARAEALPDPAPFSATIDDLLVRYRGEDA